MNLIMSLFVLSSALFAAQSAKVLFVKGEVTALLPNTMDAVNVMKGDLFPEATSILTKNRSVVRIKFSDDSTVNLGPNSKIVVSKLPKKEANIINVLTGVIKSSVNKNSNKTTKTKLVMRTQSAVMGVRGTKFQASYSPKTNKTTLLTVEGEVAMAKVEKFSPKPQTVASLDKVFDSEQKSVLVTPGKVSVTKADISKPTEPTNISPQQFDIVAKSLNSNATASVVMNDQSDDKNYDAKTDISRNLIKYKAGGYVDFTTGNYIEPDSTAKLDKKTNTYSAPKNFTVDNNGSVKKEKKSFIKKFLPEVFRLGFFFAPYSDRIKVDNNSLDSNSSFNSKSAHYLGLNFDFVWNDKIRTILKVGGGGFELDDDIVVDDYDDNNGNSITDLLFLYTFNEKWSGIIGYSNRYRLFPYEILDSTNPRVSYEDRDLSFLTLGVNKKLNFLEKHNLSLDVLLNIYEEINSCLGSFFPGSNSCEESISSFGSTVNLNTSYRFLDSYSFKPTLWFDYIRSNADTRDYNTSRLGLTFLVEREF